MKPNVKLWWLRKSWFLLGFSLCVSFKVFIYYASFYCSKFEFLLVERKVTTVEVWGLALLGCTQLIHNNETLKSPAAQTSMPWCLLTICQNTSRPPRYTKSTGIPLFTWLIYVSVGASEDTLKKKHFYAVHVQQQRAEGQTPITRALFMFHLFQLMKCDPIASYQLASHIVPWG